MLLLAAVITAACNDPLPLKEPSQEKFSRVLIFFGEGFNSLSSYITEDISDMIGTVPNASIPSEGSNKALVIISHLPAGRSAYQTPTSPTITSITRDYIGRPKCDTLLSMDSGAIMTRTENLRYALEYVRDHFPSDSYGLIMNSHGTGWLPVGYYDGGFDSSTMSMKDMVTEGAARYIERQYPDGIVTKSFGQEVIKTGSGTYSFEFTLQALAAAIPMKMDYIVFDACLMGGIETAYELRNVTDKIAFSQAEVLADGFCYDKIVDRLLFETPANPEGVCKDYYEHYVNKTGVNQSATISLIDCTRLEGLAECCRELFSTYREGLGAVDPTSVQGFFRYDKHWFYDLEDILVKAGMSSADHRRLTNALDDCVIFKGATSSFLEDFDIKSHCGFSMYLPKAGNSYLDSFYKELEWNKASGLVE